MFWVKREVRTVDEDRLLAWVWMNIKEKGQSALLLCHIFEKVSFWIQSDGSCSCVSTKVSIHIKTTQSAPIVSNYDSIRIKHWNNFENDSLSQFTGFRRLWEYESYKSMNKPTGVSFTWMKSPYHQYGFLAFICFTEISDRENRDLNTRKTLTQNFFLKNVTVFYIFRLFLNIFDCLYEVAKHSEAIRDCIGEPYFILIIFESVL